MIDYPYYSVKVIVCMHSAVTPYHDLLNEEHIIPTMRVNTEIQAVNMAMEALRERYYRLEEEKEND